MSFVKDAWDSFTGQASADASKEAMHGQLALQQQGLDYLMESEELPMQYRDEALTHLAGIAGLPGGEGNQWDLIERARVSPLHQAIMGTRKYGENAIMRNAAATGGLRSGNIQEALFDYNQRLRERALLESYNQQLGGLQSLGRLQTNPQAVARQTNAMGRTTAQGIIGAEQAQQEGWGRIFDLATAGATKRGWI